MKIVKLEITDEIGNVQNFLFKPIEIQGVERVETIRNGDIQISVVGADEYVLMCKDQSIQIDRQQAWSLVRTLCELMCYQ